MTETPTVSPMPPVDGDTAKAKAASTNTTGARPKPLSQATKLVKLAEGCELFHTPSNVPFVTCNTNGHLETYRLRSPEFEAWLMHRMFTTSGTTPTSQAMNSALGVLHGQACFGGREHEVHVRVAEHEGAVVIDLGDPEWRVVRVTGSPGYTLLAQSPVKFRRPKGLLALPQPQPGGSLDDLRPFVNLPDDRQWRLLVAFLLAAFRPSGPYPMLEVNGDQGSGKSVMTKIVRALVDPNVAPARSLGGLHDLALAANNGWLLAFDNISTISKAMSDALCRVSTGGASANRTLYENDGETLFEAQRPAVLNGIGNFITESDLLDRTLVLELPTIPSAERRDERQFWESFKEVQPKVFGALLDGVARAMRNIDAVAERSDWPRMVDFAKWVTAAEPQLGWPPGAFMEAYNSNRAEANARVLDDDKVALEITTLADAGDWSGNATELLTAINPGGVAGFPQAPNRLVQRLRELKPNLEAIGVKLQFVRKGADSKKMILIAKRTRRAAA